MSRKKNKPAAKPKAAKSRAKARTAEEKRAPRPRSIIRNAAPARAAPRSAPTEEEPERTALTTRVDDMGASHVGAGIGAGVLGNAVSVLLVGQGWVGPKLTAGLLVGTGAAATAAATR